MNFKKKLQFNFPQIQMKPQYFICKKLLKLWICNVLWDPALFGRKLQRFNSILFTKITTFYFWTCIYWCPKLILFASNITLQHHGLMLIFLDLWLIEIYANFIKINLMYNAGSCTHTLFIHIKNILYRYSKIPASKKQRNDKKCIMCKEKTKNSFYVVS